MPLAFDLTSTLTRGWILPVATTERAMSPRSTEASFEGSISCRDPKAAFRPTNATTRRIPPPISSVRVRLLGLSPAVTDRLSGKDAFASYNEAGPSGVPGMWARLGGGPVEDLADLAQECVGREGLLEGGAPALEAARAADA